MLYFYALKNWRRKNANKTIDLYKNCCIIIVTVKEGGVQDANY